MSKKYSPLMIADLKNMIAELQDMIDRHTENPDFYDVDYIVDDFYEIDRPIGGVFDRGEYDQWIPRTEKFNSNEETEKETGN